MRYHLIIVFLIASLPVLGQWNSSGTNIYYGGGNVGIGSLTSPRGIFDVNGSGDIFLSNNTTSGTTQSVYLPGHIYMAPYNGSDWTYLQARRSDNSGSTHLQLRTWHAGALTEAMVITSIGRVGVGTNSPRAPLEVMVAGNNNTVQTGLIIQQNNPGVPNNTSGVSLDFGIGNNAVNNNIEGRITLKETYFSARPKMIFSLWDQNNTMQDRVAIDDAGNVGIGTMSPEGFQVQKNLTNEASQSQDNVRIGILGTPRIILDKAGHTPFELDNANGRFRIFSPGVERFTITSDGNVGIGTTNPNQKLTVNGTIYGKEVKVDLNVPGPDYVFEPTYQLPSLTETEAYIKAHKHLPEVPSAKEMEANGINLSEMNMLLLKKVEELTLHVIQLKKRDEAMQKELNALKKKKLSEP